MATIIAECCQNHNGDLNILKDMIWVAADAGADIVKIQSMLSNDLTHRERFDTGIEEDDVQKAIQRPYQAEYDRLKPLDLDDDAHHWFIEECQKANIKPMTTVFSRSRVEFLGSLPWDAIKIASYDCASLPLLRELMPHFSHLFISTGATFDEEIEQTAKLLKDHSFSFLHCVTIYPTPLDEMHLNRINYLRKYAPSVGFSDHSLIARDGLKSTFAALYFGADIIERHYSVLAPDETKDGPVSINPEQLREIVDFAKLSKEDQKTYVDEHIPEYNDVMMGQEKRDLSDVELLNRDYYRGRFASSADGEMVYNWEDSA